MSAPSACRPLMCWSTGREPMAQPPGSDTFASPKRASRGPSTRIDARIVLTSSYGASSLLMAEPFMTTLSPFCSMARPVWRSSFSIVATSCRFGTFDSSRSPAVSRPAHKIGSAAFLPPVMSSLSIEASLALVFFRGQRLHRQRVDFLAHAVAQGRVHQLVALDRALAGECGRDDDGLEVLAVAFHLQVGAFEAGGDVAVDCFWGRGHDGS